ncbi:type VI secretion system tube protein TssD [Dyadobacter sp. CY323]|uniref:type VI secretion system tube protein TssD n=1 Tax=Dyadobacter sp. CY323 TaxID=2907302 RepID=UPI001F40005D|nr:type VI secretion system tube protein TssD [Dyadobacter sp. CY323]MCE6988888.1 hypothetical protein [Dyadobacter sp. CY323]
MAFSTNVKIDGDHEYSVMFMRFELHQTVDDAMSITSPIQWAHLYMELEMVMDDFLIEWANKPSQKYDLTVEQFGENGPFKTLSFKDSVCTEFVEMFDDGTDDMDKKLAKRLQNFITCLTITASSVEIDEAKLENF